jgi:small-conductance mechanosensitive channel
MDQNTLKQVIDGMTSQYMWWFIGAALAIWAKDVIENVVTAAAFVLSRDYNVDDEVLIGGTKKARIVRQTFTKTVFYIYENNTRLVIPNREFYSLRCEKVLPGCERSN